MERSETTTPGLKLRGAVPADQAYIASTLVASLGLVDKPRQAWERGQLADKLLDKAGVKVAVAAEIATDKILGWMIYSPMPSVFCHHYVYVRNPERKRGLASALAIHTGLSSAQHVVFTLGGPSEVWLRIKHPHASHLPIEDFLK